jgi:hypothetical protein
MFSTINLHKIRTHPWAVLAPRAVFLVPVDIIVRMANPHVGPLTDLGENTWVQKPQEDVWQTILVEGMNDPFVLSLDAFGPSPRMRLEAGNHRVRCAQASGISHLPCVALSVSQAPFHKGDPKGGLDVSPQAVKRWLSSLGREDHLKDVLPHPVDLQSVLPWTAAHPILCLDEITNIKVKDGLLHFKPAPHAPCTLIEGETSF